jgi:hypothetical protein
VLCIKATGTGNPKTQHKSTRSASENVFLSQVDLPVPLGPKIKKLPTGGAKNLSVNFSIGLLQDDCLRLNLRLKVTLSGKIRKKFIFPSG